MVSDLSILNQITSKCEICFLYKSLKFLANFLRVDKKPLSSATIVLHYQGLRKFDIILAITCKSRNLFLMLSDKKPYYPYSSITTDACVKVVALIFKNINTIIFLHV